MALGDLQWSLVVGGGDMVLRSVKLPPDDEDAETPRDRERERAANFLLIHDLVRRLYREFLRVRLGAGYLHGEAERQATWMARA